ncbi:MAG: hypothetical protein DWH74_03850 [Planctomycetota bacterium]|nr:MAG: hypothetical protein DWH74_03850 [Planctomycetota bacterium]
MGVHRAQILYGVFPAKTAHSAAARRRSVSRESPRSLQMNHRPPRRRGTGRCCFMVAPIDPIHFTHRGGALSAGRSADAFGL